MDVLEFSDVLLEELAKIRQGGCLLIEFELLLLDRGNGASQRLEHLRLAVLKLLLTATELFEFLTLAFQLLLLPSKLQHLLAGLLHSGVDFSTAGGGTAA